MSAIYKPEVINIDMKMDDGKPGMGSIQTFNNTFLSSCASTNVASTAIYRVDNTASKACSLFLLDVF